MIVSRNIDRCLTIIWFILVLAFIAMPQLKYYSIHTGVADLGFFLAGIYKVNTQWPHIFYGHVQPYMYLYGIAFKFFPYNFAPFALLALQSIFILLAITLMRKYYGNLAAIALLLYSMIWSNNLFDFHFDHISILLLSIFFVGCKTKRYGMAMISAILLCFVKEIFALQAAACGIYIIIVSHKDSTVFKTWMRHFISLLVTCFAFLWFYISIKFLLPYFSDGGKTPLDSGAFSWLGNNIKEIISSVVFHPIQILEDILFTPKKVFYVVALLGPFIFIPLLRPLPLMVASPIFMVSMLSHQSNYYDYAAHYSAGLIIPIIVAYVEGTVLVKKWFYFFCKKVNLCKEVYSSNNFDIFNLFLISWLLFFQVLLGVSPISRLFWSDKIWSSSYKAYISSSRDSIIREAIEKYIPLSDNLIISSQNNINHVRLAMRQNYLLFPGGVTEPHHLTNWNEKTFNNFLDFVNGKTDFEKTIPKLAYADYVLIDTKRPYFVYDLGCDTTYAVCSNKSMERLFLESTQVLESSYSLLYDYDGFKIFLRNN